MLPSKSQWTVWLVVIFVIYCSGAPSTSNIPKKNLTKRYTIPNFNNLIFNLLSSYNATHMVYGYCTDLHSKKNCTIVESRLNITAVLFSCGITIEDSRENNTFYDNTSVILLRNDKALVLSTAGEKLKLININFQDCSTNEVEIEIGKSQSAHAINVLPYENSYDIFFANSKLCLNRYCRMTFDNKGNVVKGIELWGDEDIGDKEGLQLMRTVAEHSPVNGFLIENHKNGDIFLVNNEGHKLLQELKKDYHESITVSTAGNYMGICLTNTIEQDIEQVECKQYDFEGRFVKTELHVNASNFVSDRSTIYSFTRLNLPDGFILFTVLCPYNEIVGCFGDYWYVAYRFNGKGEMLKEIEINDLVRDDETWLLFSPRVFLNDVGQRCFLILDHDFYNFGISVRCFTDDEL